MIAEDFYYFYEEHSDSIIDILDQIIDTDKVDEFAENQNDY